MEGPHRRRAPRRDEGAALARGRGRRGRADVVARSRRRAPRPAARRHAQDPRDPGQVPARRGGAEAPAVVIVPSVDVRGGHVAYRGIQVRFSPSELAERYVADGARELHLVDRDMAERGDPANLALLAAIARRVRVPCRLAGGISSVPFAKEALDAGFGGVLFSSAVLASETVLRDVAALGAAGIVEVEAKDGWLAPRGGDPALVE
ncbi:MAG: hypothetical protein FJ028_11110, partial [Chloroflexi bacterium]|nr:hypothetical protein [Chloroflexota bacterium]